MREKYRKLREALIKMMGHKCVWPGCDEERFDKLQVDHIDGVEFDHDKICGTKRLERYKKEWLEGKTQILCKIHNRKKGRPGEKQLVAASADPEEEEKFY